jgi:hypothetical protein
LCWFRRFGVNARPLLGGSAFRLEASGHEPTPPRLQAAAPQNRLAHFRFSKRRNRFTSRARGAVAHARAARDSGSRRTAHKNLLGYASIYLLEIAYENKNKERGANPMSTRVVAMWGIAFLVALIGGLPYVVWVIDEKINLIS